MKIVDGFEFLTIKDMAKEAKEKEIKRCAELGIKRTLWYRIKRWLELV